MPSEVKKHFFKKEKKELRLKRHKAPSQKGKKMQEPSKTIKEPKTSFFPKNFRFITEQKLWLSILLVLATITIVLITPQVISEWTKWQNAQQEYQKLQHNLKTWEAIMQRYPTYRDAYFEAAVLSYRLGEKEKEDKYISKILAIDPNFQPALQLRKLSN